MQCVILYGGCTLPLGRHKPPRVSDRTAKPLSGGGKLAGFARGVVPKRPPLDEVVVGSLTLLPEAAKALDTGFCQTIALAVGSGALSHQHVVIL